MLQRLYRMALGMGSPLLLAGLALCPMQDVQAAPEPARRLFHLTFDGRDPFRAAVAGGQSAPADQADVQMVDGLTGKGALMRGHATLAYAEPGNLQKARGTLILWFKPAVDLTQAPGYPCFFKEDAPLGPLPTNNLWLWVSQGRLRYDLRVRPDDALCASIPAGQEGIWRQLAITWESASGSQIYLDGRRMPLFSSDRPFGMRALTWQPVAHPRFFIGSRGRDTYHSSEPIWGACESVVDEVSIYDRPLTDAEMLETYTSTLGRQDVPPLLLLRQAAAVQGKPWTPLFDLRNPHAFALNGQLEAAIESEREPRPLLSRKVTLAPGAEASLSGAPLALPPGTHRVACRYNGRLVAREILTILAPAPRPKASTAPPVLVGRYDAPSLRSDARAYCETAPAALKTLAGTPYLEAAAKPFSQVAFRFSVRNPGRPHLLKVTYPDDAERVFDIIVSSPAYPCTYDTQGGVLAGKELENTGQFQAYELLYWPRERDQALILTTWVEGMPAALSRFEVYELDPALAPALPAGVGGPGGRHLGLYWEDPMISQCFGGRPAEHDADRFAAETVDRLAAYLKWTGQDTLIYPSAFYQGPGFRTLAEGGIAGAGYERHPENYVDLILARFEEQGLRFIPEINMCLSASMLLPIPEAAARPEGGYLAVSSGGRTETGMYPRLNALDPRYQERLLAIVREMARRFAHSKAFAGVQLHLVYESPFWLGSADWGYDAATVGRFGRETGTTLPRFEGAGLPRQRYDWLMREKKDAWLDWRCAKLTEFYGRLAGALTRARPDLKLTLGLRYLAEGSAYLPHWEKEGRSMQRVYRNAGLDFARLARIPNLEVQKYFFSADIKHRKIGQPGNAMYAGLELRRSPDLQKTLTLGGTRPAGTNIYVNYFESDVGEKQPIPGFWWESPRWRVCGLSPGGRSFLELFAHSVARYDAPLITTGGFVVGTMGNNPQTAEFARAYRALPDARLATVPGSSDTAVVRAGAGWLYAVSQSPFPMAVRLAGKTPLALTDASDGSRLSGRQVRVELAPYQLRAFKGAPRAVSIVGYDLPPARREQIGQRIAALRARGEAGAAIAARVQAELERDNLVGCKYLLEEPAALDLLER